MWCLKRKFASLQSGLVSYTWTKKISLEKKYFKILRQFFVLSMTTFWDKGLSQEVKGRLEKPGLKTNSVSSQCSDFSLPVKSEGNSMVVSFLSSYYPSM